MHHRLMRSDTVYTTLLCVYTTLLCVYAVLLCVYTNHKRVCTSKRGGDGGCIHIHAMCIHTGDVSCIHKCDAYTQTFPSFAGRPEGTAVSDGADE